MRLAWVAAVGVGLLTGRASAGEERVLKSKKDKLSYAMAVAMARTIQKQGVEIDVDVFSRGMKDVLSGGTLLLPEEELRKAMSAHLAELKKHQAIAKADLESKKKAAKAFLAANAKKEGVVSLPSGLQYRVLQAGSGQTPTDADSVECHYRGTLVDGKEFDSSLRHGTPATLQVSKVIPGWREALKLMPTGSRWQLFIPPELAYGERGAGRKSVIGPNEALIFEVELVAIK